MWLDTASAGTRVLHLARIGALDPDAVVAAARIHDGYPVATTHVHAGCAFLAVRAAPGGHQLPPP